jgi:hypothetical protein
LRLEALTQRTDLGWRQELFLLEHFATRSQTGWPAEFGRLTELVRPTLFEELQGDDERRSFSLSERVDDR